MNTTRQERGRDAWRTGHRTELLAGLFLRLKGFRILARRFACHVGEIDIVAKRGRLVVFVEIKYRADPDIAAAAVTNRQWQRVTRTAEVFMPSRPGLASFDRRFDLLVFSRRKWPRHIIDTWRPDN